METLTKNLESVCKIITAQIPEFVVGEKFKHLSKDKNDLKLNLDKHFIRLVLEPMKDRRLSLNKSVELEKFKLTGEREMKRSEIQKELKGFGKYEIHVEIFMPILLSFLSIQPNGEEKDEGLIIAHSYRNCFTVNLLGGGNCDVVLTWDSKKKYWNLSVPAISHDPAWLAGRAFFTLVEVLKFAKN